MVCSLAHMASLAIVKTPLEKTHIYTRRSVHGFFLFFVFVFCFFFAVGADHSL